MFTLWMSDLASPCYSLLLIMLRSCPKKVPQLAKLMTFPSPCGNQWRKPVQKGTRSLSVCGAEPGLSHYDCWTPIYPLSLLISVPSLPHHCKCQKHIICVPVPESRSSVSLCFDSTIVVTIHWHWSHGLWRKGKEEKWILTLLLSFLFFFLSLILGQEAKKEEGERKRRERDREGKKREVGIERGRKQETKEGSFYKNDYKQARWPWVKASLQLLRKP